MLILPREIDVRDLVLVTWIVSHVYADSCNWMGTLSM